MNIIDIVIFISLIIAAISGFIKGFIISAASFIGFFSGNNYLIQVCTRC